MVVYSLFDSAGIIVITYGYNRDKYYVYGRCLHWRTIHDDECCTVHLDDNI